MEQELPLGPFTESESLLTKRVRYTNNGTAPISVLGYTNDRYELERAANLAPNALVPAFWSYQSASYESRPDWLLQNADGSPRKINWWDSDYLCPAYGPVQGDAAALAPRAQRERRKSIKSCFEVSGSFS